MNAQLVEGILNSLDPEDLVLMLELTCEDLIAAFPNKLIENAHKFEDDDA